MKFFQGTDPEGDALTFVITAGADSEFFEIVNDNQLTFKVAPDFETPEDYDRNNRYIVQIAASDGVNLSSSVRLSVNLRDVNEAPTAISIDGDSGLASLTISEASAGGTSLGTPGADDEDADETLTFSLAESANGLFAIDGTTLKLADSASLDYEVDSSYLVEIEVSDSADNIFSKSVTINVSDVEEPELEEFRSRFGLAEDGSDDSSGWSGNGVSNIFYLAFGLGDPNENDIDRTRLVSTDESEGKISFRYTRSTGGNTGITMTPLSSEDLNGWIEFLEREFDPEEEPIIEEFLDLGDGYEQVTLFIPMGDEAQQFYRLEVSVEEAM